MYKNPESMSMPPRIEKRAFVRSSSLRERDMNNVAMVTVVGVVAKTPPTCRGKCLVTGK